MKNYFELKNNDSDKQNITVKRIAELMKERNMTQAAIAKSLNVSAQTIFRWIHGKSSISVANLEKLAAVLGTTTDYLYGISDAKNEEELHRIIETARKKVLMEQEAEINKRNYRKMQKEIIGARLRRYRTACNMTQIELAEKVGATYYMVDKWEKGIVKPTINTLIKTAKALNVKVTDLIDPSLFDKQPDYAPVLREVVSLLNTATALLESITG